MVWAVPLATGTGDGTADNCSLAQAVSGTLDSIWLNLCTSIKASRPGKGDIFRPGWEMNGNWFSWYALGKESDYIAAFRRFVAIARQVFGTRGTAFSWCPTLDGTTANPESFYPGDAYVDFIGWDAYYDGTAWAGDGAGYWSYELTSAAYSLTNLESFATAHGKRIAIDEWGVNDNTGGVTVVNSRAAWMAARNIAYHCYYFETAVFNGRFDQYPAVQAAYVAAFGPPTISTGDVTVPAGSSSTISLAADQTITWSLTPATGYSLAGSTLTYPSATESTVDSVTITATNVYGMATNKTISITHHTATPITNSTATVMTPKTVGATTFTWAAEAIGAASASRKVVVGLNYRAAGTPSLTSVVIGGVTATINKHQINTSDTNTSGAIIASADVPTGTTADIVATFSGSVARIGGGHESIFGTSSTAPATAGSNTASDGDPSITIDEYAGGYVFATEYYTKSAATAEQRSSVASILTAAAAPGATISVTNTAADASWSGITEFVDQQLTTASSAPQALAVASWMPL